MSEGGVSKSVSRGESSELRPKGFAKERFRGVEKLDGIRSRLEAATEGPWEVRGDDLTDDVDIVHDQEQFSFVASCGQRDMPRAQADAQFIANARTDIPKLVVAVGVLEDLIASLEESSEFTSDPRLLAMLLRRKLDEALEGG